MVDSTWLFFGVQISKHLVASNIKEMDCHFVLASIPQMSKVHSHLLIFCLLLWLCSCTTAQCPAGTAFKEDFHTFNELLWDPSFSNGLSQTPAYMELLDHCHFNMSEDGWYGLAMSLDNTPCSTNSTACHGAVYAGCHLRTSACYSFGTYEVLMRVSHPDGPKTMACFATYIDDPTHNEIDICFNSDNSVLHAAYFTSPTEILEPVSLGFDASLDFHHFSFVWTPTNITWYVDGQVKYVADGSKGKLPWEPQQIVLILRPLSTTFDGVAFQDVVYVSYTPL